MNNTYQSLLYQALPQEADPIERMYALFQKEILPELVREIQRERGYRRIRTESYFRQENTA